MKRSIGDSVRTFLKRLMGPAHVEEIPVTERIQSARMSHTRLKALERPDIAPHERATNLVGKYSGEKSRISQNDLPALPPLGADGLPDLTPFMGKRASREANVSHYRLAAYVANLAPEERSRVLGADEL